jgi:hypothetical protein
MAWLSGNIPFPAGSYRWVSFILPPNTSPRAIQDRARLRGYTMPFVQESGTKFDNGGVAYMALVEPRVTKYVAEFAQALKASTAVISSEPVPAIMEMMLETKSLVTGDRASFPVDWARADEYVTGGKWYIAVGTWAQAAPSYEFIRGRAASVDVETYFPQQTMDASTSNLVMFLVRPTGVRFRVGALMSTLGATVVLINKHPMPVSADIDLVKDLDAASVEFQGSLKDLAVTLSEVPGALVGLLDAGVGVLPTAFDLASILVPVAVVGALGLGGYWLYTKVRPRARAWRNT